MLVSLSGGHQRPPGAGGIEARDRSHTERPAIKSTTKERIKVALISSLGKERARRVANPIVRTIAPAFWGNVRRRAPFSRDWGRERGTPIDRAYIEGFIESRAHLIRGAVLEVRDPELVSRFGRELTRIEVLDIDADNPEATIVADLAEVGSLPAATFDCAVITQVLQYVSSPVDAVSNALQSLRPGGSLLLSVPGVMHSESHTIESDNWRFLLAGVKKIVGEATAGGDYDIDIEAFGNAKTVLGVAAGLVLEDGFDRYLYPADPQYPLTICACITRRPEAPAGTSPSE